MALKEVEGFSSCRLQESVSHPFEQRTARERAVDSLRWVSDERKGRAMASDSPVACQGVEGDAKSVQLRRRS